MFGNFHYPTQNKTVEGLGTILWNGISVHDFLPNWIIFFHFLSTWMSDLYITKIAFSFNAQQLKTDVSLFSITEPCRFSFEQRFLIQSGYYIIHSPSTTLYSKWESSLCNVFRKLYFFIDNAKKYFLSSMKIMLTAWLLVQKFVLIFISPKTTVLRINDKV